MLMLGCKVVNTLWPVHVFINLLLQLNVECYIAKCNSVVLFQDEEEEIKLEINVLKKVGYNQLCIAFYSKHVFCQHIYGLSELYMKRYCF